MGDVAPRHARAAEARVRRRARVAAALARMGARPAEALARRRVPLGFITAGAVLLLADPTWRTWAVGLAVALVGEAFRVWAAGHLEKSREVTRSGPYGLTRHPLYAGSAVIALGVVVAANSLVVGIVTAIYLAATVTAAVRTEEAFLRSAFGNTYEEYRGSRAEPMTRRFSWARVRQNREYRALSGVLIGFALLALRIVMPV